MANIELTKFVSMSVHIGGMQGIGRILKGINTAKVIEDFGTAGPHHRRTRFVFRCRGSVNDADMEMVVAKGNRKG
jgi:hypothetical protein